MSSEAAPSKSSIGRRAEEWAAEYLESKGFRIIAKNFRTRFGEIDLIADDGGVLALVEVKYRRDESFAPAEESLTAGKQKKLLRAGRAAAVRFGRHQNIRFDFIAMIGSADKLEIRHYRDVFEGSDL